MYWLKNIELKRMLLALLISLLILGLINVSISYITIKDVNNKITLNNAKIMATIIKKYPEAEQEVIKDITNMNNNIKEAKALLKKYGIEEDRYYTEYLYNLRSNVIVINFIFFISTFIVFFITGSIFIKKIYIKIGNINKNTNNVLNKNYNLNLIDDNEGDLSILNNNIYKITTSLKEQKELLSREKLYLKDALSDISHQLKTPLTSLNIIADILKRDLMKEEKEIFLDKMNSSLNRISWLISSLLKLSQLDSGTIELEKKEVNIKELVNASIKPLLVLIELKEQDILTSGDSKLSIIGDFNWLREALDNIIKNSVEHTRKAGKIEITWSDNPIYAEIVIRDNGEGINKKDLPHIFDRFYKTKSSNKNSIGIGLAMAKTIINNQNGDISIKSDKDEYTEFTIKFYKILP